jgi:hypothetical protein
MTLVAGGMPDAVNIEGCSKAAMPVRLCLLAVIGVRAVFRYGVLIERPGQAAA